VHPSEFFRCASHAPITPEELLRHALDDAVSDSRRAAVALHASLAELAAAAPEELFADFTTRAEALKGSFNPFRPDVELLNLASRAHHAALINGVHDQLHAPLGALSAAQDKLDEAHYIVRQYARPHHNGALLAAGIRTGHWEHQEALARTTSVRAVVCVDLTASSRLAAVADCPVMLIIALDRLSVAEAVAAAASVGCRASR